MSSVYGENLKLSIFGQSHGPSISMTLDGIPAGKSINFEKLQAFLNRRAPGQSPLTTSRKEADSPEFLSGIENGSTSGAPITAVIHNTDVKSADYDQFRDVPRPGHADYTALAKYGENADIHGGGQFSGRMTAPMCIAGGMCKQWLEEMGIEISAQIRQIGAVSSDSFLVQPEVAKKMEEEIRNAKENGDSVGGSIRCQVTGLPVGIGGPLFEGLEGKLSSILFAIPAVKAVEFGEGTNFAMLHGSEANDAFIIDNGAICTATNHCGGILGGISNGMPLDFTVTFKPTPSISLPQDSVSLSERKPVKLQIHGRHDPCIVPRALPVVEAAASIAIFDLLLRN